MKQQLLGLVGLPLLMFLCLSHTPSPLLSEQSIGESQGVFIRVFKHEKVLEVWGQRTAASSFTKIKSIPICAASGNLGPKRQEGDRQVPEGFYKIDLFNPNSKYHLSMRVNYPNKSDKIRTTNRSRPGGLIMIHGGCASIGCVSIGNDNIEYLYALMETQKRKGQSVLPVHIFPCKMNTLRYKILNYLKRDENNLREFWRELEAGFDYFERKKRVPNVEINSKGQYYLHSNQPLL